MSRVQNVIEYQAYLCNHRWVSFVISISETPEILLLNEPEKSVMVFNALFYIDIFKVSKGNSEKKTEQKQVSILDLSEISRSYIYLNVKQQLHKIYKHKIACYALVTNISCMTDYLYLKNKGKTEEYLCERYGLVNRR